METVTMNEMNAVLTLFKDFSTDYNANNLSKRLGLTPMGTLKILKRLEKQGILKSRQMGRAVFYRMDFSNDYTRTYLRFILQKEAEHSTPRVKRWVKELRKFKDAADIGILFGSVLSHKEFSDVDVLLVFKHNQNKKINSLLKEISGLSVKRIHAVKQTKDDLKVNIKSMDKVVLSILRRGIVLFGYDQLIKVVESAKKTI
ncbi:hypothetical protein HQ545_04530 [Candidatus Woesearchaeota archaeon]|nr:hypothetical protein [Candidatus Woesearchaeota archaeon]